MEEEEPRNYLGKPLCPSPNVSRAAAKMRSRYGSRWRARVKEIKTDGQIWVWVADGGEQTAWRECDRKMAAEQGQRRATSEVSVAATAPLGNPGYYISQHERIIVF